METNIRIFPPKNGLQGHLVLSGSKSISNRALLILELIGANPGLYLQRISDAEDTRILQRLLADKQTMHYDAGDAGTVFRFMTAFLALQPEEQVLTGSERMLLRPIGPLVDALRHLGAEITYLGKTGFPPLKIGDGWQLGLHRNQVRVPAGISSQFLSALAIIGPVLPHGLVLHPDGPVVSRPYLDMTLELMRHMGADWEWVEGVLHIATGSYRPGVLRVEADWSAASYWYAMATLCSPVDLLLEGLYADSWQGDARIAVLAQRFGVQTTFETAGIRLTRNDTAPPAIFEFDFTDCPDLFPAVSVLCGGLGVRGLFSGLASLRIKESDRILALQTELSKVGVQLTPKPASDPGSFVQEGKAKWTLPPVFDAWNDHRIAMATATLGMLGEVQVNTPEVVAKSYPHFWKDLRSIGA
ncbi:MAG: 3-phosphoshikimate 1-carboxyvinyltransferase [Saprospiraceae bacterium]|nr:3-phosphoshikimate 1-carboxyvinyltransferase [Saprospiraceae bacterium]